MLEGPLAQEVDIPPAIACAHCGKVTCDGCAPSLAVAPPQDDSRLPWEATAGGLHTRLFGTAEFTSHCPDAAFGKLGRGSVMRALAFATYCEVWAVGSFSLLWGLAFYLAFPFMATRMMTSGAVLLLAGSILLSLIVFVVVLHAAWGIGLELGIARTARRPDYNVGVRFGLYACGWDLLTSPAGFLAATKRAGIKAGFRSVRAGARVPRHALSSYLEGCRKLDERERRTAIWTAVTVGSIATLLFGALLVASLLAVWTPGIFG